MFKWLNGLRARLRFEPELWEAMISDLEQRGRHDRESGAFLLSPRRGDGRTITRYVLMDDLDPHCLRGHIHFEGAAFAKLWDLCDAHELRVVGDVHTHPGRIVRQSPVDRENPMIARAGHLGMIVPNFATGSITPYDVGLHEYLGERGWTSWLEDDARKRIFIGRWG